MSRRIPTPREPKPPGLSRKDETAIAGRSGVDSRTVRRRLNGKPVMSDRAEAIDAAVVALGIHIPPRAPSP